MLSIHGVSDKTAALLLAELGDPLSFNGAREIVAFAGLNSRTGSSRLRASRYMPPIVAMHHNLAIRALRERLRKRSKVGKQIICAAMRKLLHIVYGVLETGMPFDPTLAVAR
ncbi:transposase [Modicisalibacter xianhensis]|uniref:transposase n=1 Tax=Modicisalibacter xianhensis TaxID=442341 RepID=UPI0030ECA5B8